MTSDTNQIISDVEKFIEAARAGFALAFHINFTTPRHLFQTYAPEWVKFYSENGLVMSDPTVLWGFENDGTIRWSNLTDMDSAGVLEKAKEHGMAYGITCALTLDETRTIGSFSRDDREFTDDEIDNLMAMLKKMHSETAKPNAMTSDIKTALEDLSVQIQSS